MRLGEDDDLLARHTLQRKLDVRVRAVLIGGIPEGDAVIVGGLEQVGETLGSELTGLVRTSAGAIGAAALRQRG